MSGVDRTQVLRIDCPQCKGKGYKGTSGAETPCNGPSEEAGATGCGGSGVLEREVGFKFETQGKWSVEEKAEAFGIPVEEVRDADHSTGD